MKFFVVSLIFLFGFKAFGSGVMIRPPSIDPCTLYPNSEKCSPKEKASDTKASGVNADSPSAGLQDDSPSGAPDTLPSGDLLNGRSQEGSEATQGSTDEPTNGSAEASLDRLKTKGKQRVNPCQVDPKSPRCQRYKAWLKKRKMRKAKQAFCRKHPENQKCAPKEQ